ncbi:hypothetical protein Gotur_020573 [Gossypium turneri]
MQLDFGIQRNERIVSELELQAAKNKNSHTQLGQKVLLV